MRINPAEAPLAPAVEADLSEPLGWVQPYARDWFPYFEEAVNGVGNAMESYARGYSLDDLPSDKVFADALAQIRSARALMKREREARRATTG